MTSKNTQKVPNKHIVHLERKEREVILFTAQKFSFDGTQMVLLEFSMMTFLTFS